MLLDIDLELGPGQVVAVIGHNGVGTTTQLRCLAGVIPPRAGDIRWNGVDSLRDHLLRHT